MDRLLLVCEDSFQVAEDARRLWDSVGGAGSRMEIASDYPSAWQACTSLRRGDVVSLDSKLGEGEDDGLQLLSRIIGLNSGCTVCWHSRVSLDSVAPGPSCLDTGRVISEVTRVDLDELIPAFRGGTAIPSDKCVKCAVDPTGLRSRPPQVLAAPESVIAAYLLLSAQRMYAGTSARTSTVEPDEVFWESVQRQVLATGAPCSDRPTLEEVRRALERMA